MVSKILENLKLAFLSAFDKGTVYHNHVAFFHSLVAKLDR